MAKKYLLPILGVGFLVGTLPFGETGSAAAFVLIAGLVVFQSLVVKRELLFKLLGLAAFLFACSHVAFFYKDQGLTDLLSIAGYVPVLALFALLYRRRVRRLEFSAFLETVSLGLVGTMVVILVQSYAQVPVQRILVQLGPLFGAMFAAVSLMGRGRSVLSRALTLSVVMAAVMEILDPQLPIEHWSRLWAVPFLPTLYGMSLPESERNISSSHVSTRRVFGPRQQLLFLGLQIIAVGVFLLSTTRDEPLLVAVLGALALVALATISIRFGLLIKQRDWSHSQERTLKAFGERIISSPSEELKSVTLQALEQLSPSGSRIAILEQNPESDEFVESRSTAPQSEVKTKFRPLRLGKGFDEVEFWFNTPATSELCVPIPTKSQTSQGFFVLSSPASIEQDVEEHYTSAAGQYSMALNASALTEQIQEERSINRFNTLTQDSNDMVFLVDRTTKEIRFAGSTVERLGYDRNRLAGSQIFSFFFDDDIDLVKGFLIDSDADRPKQTIDVRLCQNADEVRWYEMSVRNLSDSDGIDGLLLNLSDIHDRKLSDFNLRNSEARFRALVQNSRDVSMLVDSELTVTFVSPNVSSVFQLDPQHLTGTSLLSFMKNSSHDELTEAISECKNTRRSTQVDVKIHNSLGSDHKLAAVTVSPSELDENEVYVLTMQDVSTTRELEQSLRRQALYDDLTGLLNRNAFIHEVQVALRELEEPHGAAVVVLNIRNFKELGDSVGFKAGDAVIASVASRLQARLRNDDILCRLSAEEFAFLTPVEDDSKAVLLTQRILEIFDTPFTLDGDQSIRLEAGAGIATTMSRETSPSELIQRALLAMHRSNTSVDRGKPKLFSSEMKQEAIERFELATDLGKALERGEFSLVFQPLISLADNHVHSFEALLRWNHPERGNISPAVFIPIAEGNGIIEEIGRWVLEQACKTLIKWHLMYREFSDTTMAVNLSARQLDIDGELTKLVDIINDAEMDPRHLTLELTESVMVEDADKIRSQLDYLRQMGVSIAIDDFGTGVNGLAHLRDFPFDIIKIDKVYVDQIGITDEGTTLVQQLVELSNGVGAKKVVAEGIETPAQAEALTEMGCQVGQGFYLARPMSEDKLIAWLQARHQGKLIRH